MRTGEWDSVSQYELYNHQDRSVAQVIIEDHFKRKILHNDVALLLLDTPVELNPVVGTICLPDHGANFDGQNCLVTGWGAKEFGDQVQYEQILKKIELPVVPSDQCQQTLRGTRLGSSFRLDESFICAGGKKGQDTCKV